MLYVAFIIMTIYCFYIVLYFKDMVYTNKEIKVRKAIVAGIIFILPYIFGINFVGSSLDILFFIVPLCISLHYINDMNWLKTIAMSLLAILMVFCLQGIVYATWFIFFINITGVIKVLSISTYYQTIIIAVVISFILFLIFKKGMFDHDSIKLLLQYKNQLKILLTYEITLTIFLGFLKCNVFLVNNIVEHYVLVLVSSFIGLVFLMFIVAGCIKTNKIIENSKYIKKIEEQYKRQIGHYKIYTKHIERLRAFKHDYNALAKTVKSLIYLGEHNKAASLLDEMSDALKEQVKSYKMFSTNVIVDAIFRYVADTCDKKDVRYSLSAHIPENLEFSDMNIMRMFTNITDNAIEACLRIKGNDKYIKISTAVKEGWFIVNAENSYDGDITINPTNPETSKDNKELHGFGIWIIRDIVEKSGGFIVIDQDPKKKQFQLRLHIPYKNR